MELNLDALAFDDDSYDVPLMERQDAFVGRKTIPLQAEYSDHSEPSESDSESRHTSESVQLSENIRSSDDESSVDTQAKPSPISQLNSKFIAVMCVLGVIFTVIEPKSVAPVVMFTAAFTAFILHRPMLTCTTRAKLLTLLGYAVIAVLWFTIIWSKYYKLQIGVGKVTPQLFRIFCRRQLISVLLWPGSFTVEVLKSSLLPIITIVSEFIITMYIR